MLVLAHQRRRGDFRDHEAGIEPRLRRQEGRQVMGKRRIDHQRHPALGDCSDLGYGKCYLVGGKSDRLGMKVAAGNDASLLHQNQRIVGNRIGFGFERLPGKAQQVERRTRHLWLTADAIGILHPRVAFAVAFADFRTFHDLPHGVADIDLAPVAAQAVNAFAQRCGRPHDRIGRKTGGDDCRLRIAHCVEIAGQRAGS